MIDRRAVAAPLTPAGFAFLRGINGVQADSVAANIEGIGVSQ
jgi:hypothetical protein